MAIIESNIFSRLCFENVSTRFSEVAWYDSMVHTKGRQPALSRKRHRAIILATPAVLSGRGVSTCEVGRVSRYEKSMLRNYRVLQSLSRVGRVRMLLFEPRLHPALSPVEMPCVRKSYESRPLPGARPAQMDRLAGLAGGLEGHRDRKTSVLSRSLPTGDV